LNVIGVGWTDLTAVGTAVSGLVSLALSFVLVNISMHEVQVVDINGNKH